MMFIKVRDAVSFMVTGVVVIVGVTCFQMLEILLS